MSGKPDREAELKLYDFTRAPNPRRVRIFLTEKGIPAKAGTHRPVPRAREIMDPLLRGGLSPM